MRRDMRLLEFLLQRDRAKTVLLSAEGLSANLWRFPPEALRDFRGMAAGVEVTCVLVVREAAEWLVSMHRQAILNNANPRLGFGGSDTVEAYAARPHVRAMLDHGRLAADAVAAFGAVRCAVIDYGPGAFAQICAVLGLDALGLAPPERVNVSVSAAAAEVMRLANAEGAGEPVRATLRWLLQEVEPGTHNRLRHAGPPDAADRASAAELLERLRPGGADERALVARLREAALRRLA
jgi:hypothetical protein